MDIKKLSGKLLSVHIDPDDDIITFTIGHWSGKPVKKVSFQAVGDCCSSSYFYEIVGAEKVLGKWIQEVEELSLDVEPGTESIGTDYPYVVEAYAYRVSSEPGKLDLGSATIDVSNSMIIVFRNDSNGYYGGTLEPTEQHTDKVEITSSWHVTD